MAAKVSVTLDYPAAMAKATVDALPPGQAHWWVRKEAEFMRLPRRIRGDEPLQVTLWLEPGRYSIGVGPVRGGMRADLEVEAEADDGAPAAEAASPTKIAIRGKSFVITGEFDGHERDQVKAWLVGQGAKVATSVSGKTDYVLAGDEPGAKKLEKAAELGTPVIGAADVGLPSTPVAAAPAPNAPAAKAANASTPLAAFIAKCDLAKLDPKIEKLVGPKHFSDLGLHEHALWGIAIGPRGGNYHVYIDLNDRPKYAMQCNCREWRPCKHAYALLLTAQRHFVPPAPPPDNHEETARYRPGME